MKLRGKQFKSSLKTNNRTEVCRKLKDFRSDVGRVDPDAGKITVEALAERFMATVQHQAPTTVRKKWEIVERIKKKWGALPAKDLKKSQVLSWLAAFKFGGTSRNKHLRIVRAMYKMGVDDRI